MDTAASTVPAPGASAAERYAQLNYAIDKILEKAPHASVFLDGSHSAWLGVSEAAHRLVHRRLRGGARQGFYLNISNYQPSAELVQFGTWVSRSRAARPRRARWCAR